MNTQESIDVMNRLIEYTLLAIITRLLLDPAEKWLIKAYRENLIQQLLGCLSGELAIPYELPFSIEDEQTICENLRCFLSHHGIHKNYTELYNILLDTCFFHDVMQTLTTQYHRPHLSRL